MNDHERAEGAAARASSAACDLALEHLHVATDTLGPLLARVLAGDLPYTDPQVQRAAREMRYACACASEWVGGPTP